LVGWSLIDFRRKAEGNFAFEKRSGTNGVGCTFGIPPGGMGGNHFAGGQFDSAAGIAGVHAPDPRARGFCRPTHLWARPGRHAVSPGFRAVGGDPPHQDLKGGGTGGGKGGGKGGREKRSKRLRSCKTLAQPGSMGAQMGGTVMGDRGGAEGVDCIGPAPERAEGGTLRYCGGFVGRNLGPAKQGGQM